MKYSCHTLESLKNDVLADNDLYFVFGYLYTNGIRKSDAFTIRRKFGSYSKVVFVDVNDRYPKKLSSKNAYLCTDLQVLPMGSHYEFNHEYNFINDWDGKKQELSIPGKKNIDIVDYYNSVDQTLW